MKGFQPPPELRDVVLRKLDATVKFLQHNTESLTCSRWSHVQLRPLTPNIFTEPQLVLLLGLFNSPEDCDHDATASLHLRVFSWPAPPRGCKSAYAFFNLIELSPIGTSAAVIAPLLRTEQLAKAPEGLALARENLRLLSFILAYRAAREFDTALFIMGAQMCDVISLGSTLYDIVVRSLSLSLAPNMQYLLTLTLIF